MNVLDLLTERQRKEYDAWEAEMHQKAKKLQGTDEPYFGAIGGDITFKITSTSLGEVIEASCSRGAIDLTEYDKW